MSLRNCPPHRNSPSWRAEEPGAAPSTSAQRPLRRCRWLPRDSSCRRGERERRGWARSRRRGRRRAEFACRGNTGAQCRSTGFPPVRHTAISGGQRGAASSFSVLVSFQCCGGGHNETSVCHHDGVAGRRVNRSRLRTDVPFGGGLDHAHRRHLGPGQLDRMGDANWQAQDGAIVADRRKGGFLVSKNSYRDFSSEPSSGPITRRTAASSCALRPQGDHRQELL